MYYFLFPVIESSLVWSLCVHIYTLFGNKVNQLFSENIGVVWHYQKAISQNFLGQTSDIPVTIFSITLWLSPLKVYSIPKIILSIKIESFLFCHQDYEQKRKYVGYHESILIMRSVKSVHSGTIFIYFYDNDWEEKKGSEINLGIYSIISSKCKALGGLEWNTLACQEENI